MPPTDRRMMARHTSEARKLRKQLDDQLATLNRQTGRNQVWAAAQNVR